MHGRRLVLSIGLGTCLALAGCAGATGADGPPNDDPPLVVRSRPAANPADQAASGDGSVGDPPPSGQDANGDAAPSYQAQYVTVTGTVTVEETGEPWPGAWVELKDAFAVSDAYGVGPNVGTVTGADGSYTLQVLPGEYKAFAGDKCQDGALIILEGRDISDNLVQEPGNEVINFVGTLGEPSSMDGC